MPTKPIASILTFRQNRRMNEGPRLSEPFLMPIGATAAVAASCLLAGWLELIEVDAPYLVLFPVVAGCCAIGGFALAMWSLVLSGVGLVYFFIPPRGFSIPCLTDLMHLGVFVATALFVCWIIDGLKRSNEELSRDNVTLGVKLSTLLKRIRPT
jgi:K+-sensing histidine kinase KdpD